MKILLAPSENKASGGKSPFRCDALLFGSKLLSVRNTLCDAYNRLIEQHDIEALQKLFGLKDAAQIASYLKGIDENAPSLKAIERYSGVAFEYIDYGSLPKASQSYIDEHVIVFSNLFGPLLASDMIPEYKLKQGEGIAGIKPEKLYKAHAQALLDAYLSSDEILDLRAGFYDKFYKPSHPYTTLKFLKAGKSISHWAKAYRGMVTRACALHQISTVDELLKLPIEGLKVKEITQIKNHTQIIYEIEAT